MTELNPFTIVSGAVVDLLTRHGGLFVSMGTNMFRGFAIILIAWFGIRAALSSTEGHAVPFGRFANLLLTIAIGFTMITFYDRPIPGIGRSFTHLITDQAQVLAAQLETSQVQLLSDRLSEVYVSLEQPMFYNVVQVVGYFLVAIFVTLARVSLVAVIAFGWVATAVAVLVGPIFIPFFIVPHMEWMFWGWFKSLIQYSFYQVIAQAFVFVFGSFLLRAIDAFPPPYTVDKILVGGFHLIFLCVAFIYGLLKVPSLTNSLFTGRSGESAVPA
ncbi:MAG: type IV secretion system protein, partial [Thermoanaerobaculia bacterium]